MVDPSPLVPSALVEVRRSTRRRRTVSAYRDGEKIIVLMPSRLSKAEERRLIDEMVDRVTRREAKQQQLGPRADDSALMTRAQELSRNHLDALARPASVRWVTNMDHRWGSCTTIDRTIRLSHRLQSMPGWVIDYVLIHELSHLLEPAHGPEFWAWANRYPRTERARGFLEGVALAAQLPGLSSCDSSCDPSGSPDESGSAEDAESEATGALFSSVSSPSDEVSSSAVDP